MKLTNTAILRAKPRETIYKIYDGKGLYLEVSPKGGKWWRFKYRFKDKEKRISLGIYPEISLAKARELQIVVRSQVAEGIDPSEQRKEIKSQHKANQVNTLEALAREWWLDHMKDKVTSHKEKVLRRFELYFFPYIGKRIISELTIPEIAAVVKRVSDADKTDTAKRTLQTLGQVFRFAAAQGFVTRDITADLKRFLPSSKSKNMATLLNPKDIAEFLKACDSYRGGLVVKTALELAPLVFCRPGELRHAKWHDVDFANNEWSYEVRKGKLSWVQFSRGASHQNYAAI